jgi:gluconate 2-dehydrogenase gamma chain
MTSSRASDDAVDTPASPGGLTRRSLLKALPIVGGTALVACTPTSPSAPTVAPQDVDAPQRTPRGPEAFPDSEGYRFFTEEEARTVDAVVGRLIPGDASDPGAVEAGVTAYIDGKLADDSPYAQPTYTSGPFAQPYETRPAEVRRSAVPVSEQQLYRYGYQSESTPQERYRAGLAALDRYAQTRFGAMFAALPAARQDEILTVLDDYAQRSESAGDVQQSGGGSRAGGSEGGSGGSGRTSDDVLDRAGDVFGDADPGGLFSMMRNDTIEGMFADPAYGGNRDLVGWTLVGWPAAQRSYSPEEMLRGTDKQPQPMHGLPVMNPDRPGGGRPALEQPQPGVRSGHGGHGGHG